MKYTKTQRKAIAKTFAAVHRRLLRYKPWGDTYASYGSRYICDNIRALMDHKYNDRNAALDVINEHIRGLYSVESWLAEEGYISTEFVQAARFSASSFECKQMHAYRLRWLTALVKEFSE